MAVLTAKVEWRATTANKTSQRMLELLRDFIVTTAGWTLLTDQIGSGAVDAYFVVTKDRQTGFVGDNPIIKIQHLNATGQWSDVRSSYIRFTCYSAWSGTSGTNPTAPSSYWDQFGTYHADGGGRYVGYEPTQMLHFSTTWDTDFYISVDTTGKFILATSKVLDWGFVGNTAGSGVLHGPIQGVACFERLVGDSSTGTYFGTIESGRQLLKTSANYNTGIFPVPVRWDGVNSDNPDCYYNVGTRLGWGYSVLSYVNESGKHVMFDLEVRRQDYNRVHGKIYGLAATTNASVFPYHTIFPSISAPEWLIAKIGYVHNNGEYNLQKRIGSSPWNLAMQIGSTITTLS